MTGTSVRAPEALLLHPKLTPAAKLIWLLMHLLPDGAPRSRLSALSGLSQPTIRKVLAELAQVTIAPAKSVRFPPELLTDRRLTPGARLTFGALQLLPNFTGQTA